MRARTKRSSLVRQRAKRRAEERARTQQPDPPGTMRWKTWWDQYRANERITDLHDYTGKL